jgi:hemoglobin-like flavoprotein
MTPQQVEMVTSTWAKVVPIADTAATLFYDKLFELDPSLRPLFKDDMTEQKQKLLQTLGFAVGSLKNLDALVPVVQALGKRHVGYGVTDSMYDTVGAALLWTLEKGLGGAFTPDVKEAWTLTYTTLATVMKDAAKS